MNPLPAIAAPQFNHPVLDAQEGHPRHIQILRVVKPVLTAIAHPAAAPLILGEDGASKQAIEALQKALAEVKKKHKSVVATPIDHLQAAALTLTAEGVAACKATLAIFDELLHDLYTDESARDIVECSSALLVHHFEGGAHTRQVDELAQRVMQGNGITLRQRPDDEVNNPAYVMSEANKPFAYLKRANKAFEASHSRVIQDLPLYHVKTRALIGYEIDLLLGLHRTPATYKVVFLNTAKGVTTEEEATVQKIVPEGKPFGDSGIFAEGGATALKALDVGNVHMTALSDFIKGSAAGHIANYVFAGARLFEVDHKECMTPFNTMPTRMKVKREADHDDLEKLLQEAPDEATRQKIMARLETERKSVQMARMCILGLPQCNKPFEKASLLFLLHPSLEILMKAHHVAILKKGYNVETEALIAQLERLHQLQRLAREELAKPTIEATPRDFYFSLFGGKELYDFATQVKQYHPILVFNGIVGNSYRHYLKDLSQPETLPVRPKDKPVSDAPLAKTVFENLQALAE